MMTNPPNNLRRPSAELRDVGVRYQMLVERIPAIAIREDERRRIAENIHNDTMEQLQSLRMRLVELGRDHPVIADEDFSRAQRDIAGSISRLKQLASNPHQPHVVVTLGESRGGSFADEGVGDVESGGSQPACRTAMTPREIDVMRLLTLGHTNGEVGAILFISVRTVEHHRANLFRKLGVHSRAGLVSWVRDHPLVRAELEGARG
jgi:DNA-binding CsgD family transcriptional regulator